MKKISSLLPRMPFLMIALGLTCLPVAKVFALISAPLTPPSNLCLKASPTGITVTWSASPNALTYYVLRSVNGGAWERIAVTGLTSFDDASAGVGAVYSYSVYGEERNSVGSRFTTAISISSPSVAGTSVSQAP